jgi:hypothetical protein
VAIDSPLLYRAPRSADEAVLGQARTAANGWVVGPELASPPDRSWVVCTDYDLTSTSVASETTLAPDPVNKWPIVRA